MPDRDLDAELAEARSYANQSEKSFYRQVENYPVGATGEWIARELRALRLTLESGQRDANRRHDEQMVMLGEMEVTQRRQCRRVVGDPSPKTPRSAEARRVWDRAKAALAAREEQSNG